MSDPTLEEDSLISQDDIDKLLDSSSIEEAEEKFSNAVADDAAIDIDAVDELGELSQEDIDSLMNSNVSNPEDTVNDDLEDDDMELISQEDIDQLMNSTVSSDEEAPAPFDDDNDSSEEETVQVVVEDDLQEDDYIIDESEAVDVKDSLIAQETIDDLIKNFNTEDSSDPVILDEEPESKLEVQPDPVAEVEEEAEPETMVESDKSDEVLDDTEDFLKPDSDVAVFDFDDEDSEDVSQEDIDSLLLEEDDDEDPDDDILISQDDIDTLLMAADQEDEDVLGDLMDDGFDGSMDDDLGDEDILESDSFDETEAEEAEEDDDKDQVVLEGEDEEQPLKGKSQWYKSKLVIAGASALIVLGITIPLAYFIFFSGGPGKVIQPDPVAKVLVETHREIEIETMDVHVKKQEDIKTSGNMILKDFVILASDLSKDLAYVTADISIDYSDQKAYHEIQNNLSFYRDLIYDSIRKSLVSEKRQEITEADILGIVETTLKKVLPGHYIDRVSFKSFKAS